MKIYCCQLDIAWENKAANHAKALALLETAMPEAGSLVLWSEMFATGFSMNVSGIAEGSERVTEMFLAAVAAKYNIYTLGGVVTTGGDGRGRNEAVVFDPQGQLITRYCKLHPFSYGGETRHYMSGEAATSFQWHDFTAAPFICYDLRFPEIFRSAVRQGAQLFTIIANWPQAREAHWITLLQARAIENQAYVAGVNRCGHDPKLAYGGRSLIIDPRGQIIADAGGAETVISADVDLAMLLSYRQEFPALADMREG